MSFWTNSPIDPLPIKCFLGGALLAAPHLKTHWWIAPKRWRRRVVIAVLVVGAAGLLALGALAVVIALYGREDRARPADVIIVLGGGEVSSERRARHAAALYARGLAPVILCSGGYRANPASLSEADTCAQAAQAAGVPAAALVLESHSLSTQQNADAAADLMAARGWYSAVLVTDDFHLWRAAWVFRRAGVTVWPSPAQATQPGLPPDEWTFGLLREVGAMGWYALDWLRARVG